MKNIANLFTEDTILSFTNGTTVKGAKEVSEVIMNCCIEYNRGYMRAITQAAAGALLGGIITIGIVVGTNMIIKKRLKTFS